VRGALRALGVRGAVASPSFTLAQSYRGCGGLAIHHLDLYRLAPGGDTELFAWDDYLGPSAVTFVEWPEAGLTELPSATVAIALTHVDRRRRGLTLTAAPAPEHELADALRAAGASDVRVTP
jgi:tRNA threonylcarbamoyladenosine biosynthesis protein TsaE